MRTELPDMEIVLWQVGEVRVDEGVVPGSATARPACRVYIVPEGFEASSVMDRRLLEPALQVPARGDTAIKGVIQGA